MCHVEGAPRGGSARDLEPTGIRGHSRADLSRGHGPGERRSGTWLCNGHAGDPARHPGRANWSARDRCPVGTAGTYRMGVVNATMVAGGVRADAR